MIAALTIQNYALIQELHIQPSPQLNIITGETGAGKSIMLGALGLLMGQRADTKVLLREDAKCLVEATIHIEGYALQPLFESMDLDYETRTLLRREISPSGKSRAFINDTPVTLAQMKQLGTRLMDIHSQHQSLQLANNQYQLEVLDAYAAHKKFLEAYQHAYDRWRTLQKAYNNMCKQAAADKEQLDYRQFLYEELEKANLDGFDQAEMEEELELLEHAEEIKIKLAQVDQLLDNAELGALQLLSDATQGLHAVASFSKGIYELAERANSTLIEWKDIHQELTRMQEDIMHDPQRMHELKGTIDNLYRLQQKHQVADQAALIKKRNELAQSLEAVVGLEEQIEQTAKKLAEAEKQLKQDAAKLTESRKLAALNFAAEIEKLIRELGIDNGTLEIDIFPINPSPNGMDHAAMRFSANKGVAPEEIQHVASGGEFSRLIFAIKYLIAGRMQLPTVIFDEIDTGVSGEVALQMIQMMKAMARNHQVISISHLPQFAAGGDKHYFVYKDHSADRSESKMRELSGSERVEEIAKMIAGKTPTDAAFSSARELLGIR